MVERLTVLVDTMTDSSSAPGTFLGFFFSPGVFSLGDFFLSSGSLFFEDLGSPFLSRPFCDAVGGSRFLLV